jgi:hypothetical protein
MVPLVLIAGASFAQDDNRAVPRGSGSSSSSSAGERHTGGSSSSGSSASSNSGNRGGGFSAGSGSEYLPAPDAASRRPRPGTGTGTRDRFGNDRDRYVGYPYSSYYYDPYFYSSFGYPGRSYGRLGYGYGYYDYGYSYGDYLGYYPSYYSRSYRYRAGNVAQIRTLVEPSKTRVYVDGYYAGTVDDFDGLLQRLNVSPGRHDITLRLEGYQSHTFSIYANREQTLKLRWDMVRGNGETRDAVGEEHARRSDPDEDDENEARERELDRERERANERGGEVDSDRNDRRTPPLPREGRDDARGELALDIQPLDASVYVDGEFYGKASQLAHLELAAGRHRIEVVRPGYRTEETEVTIDREPRKLVVKLERR